MDQVLLALRVVLSLAVVIALMWGLTRVARGRQTVRGVPIDVIARTPMGKHSSVVIVKVEGRGLVLGVTEHQMTMLAEVELTPEPAAAEVREQLDLTVVTGGTAVEPAADVIPMGRAGRRAVETAGGTALGGSVLSPQTWRDMMGALREKSVRA